MDIKCREPPRYLHSQRRIYGLGFIASVTQGFGDFRGPEGFGHRAMAAMAWKMHGLALKQKSVVGGAFGGGGGGACCDIQVQCMY